MSDIDSIGKQMYRLVEELYPICRSITGNGVRRTLEIVSRSTPMTIHEVKTGTPVFDWIVPKEWNINDAYIIAPNGEKIVDFKKNNLHVLNYSSPINATLPLEKLKEHLYTLPDHPEWIPYRTSYYQERWGFCLSHNQFIGLKEGDYKVVIDSSLSDGHLTYGEHLIKGETEDEVLLSCHICHPSLCNDNLSGIALMAHLINYLSQQKLRYSYRFLFIPGTIGSITWLSQNENTAKKIKHGLVVVCVGDPGAFTYKRSRDGNAEIDRAVLNVLTKAELSHDVIDFYPYGYDERQYCSPGFNLHVGSLSRSTHGCFPEYHTSADNLSFITADAMEESLNTYIAVMDVLENNKTYINTSPKCEPQLGKRGLYDSTGGTHTNDKNFQMALLWVLNLSDGSHTLLDISERSEIQFSTIKQAAAALCGTDLLVEASPSG